MNRLECFRSHHQHQQLQPPHLSPSSVVHPLHQTVSSLSITTTTTTDYYQYSSFATNDDSSSRLSGGNVDMDENGSNNRWRQQPQHQHQSSLSSSSQLASERQHLSPSGSQYSLVATSSGISGALDESGSAGDNGSSSSAGIWADDIEEDDELDFQHAAISFGAEIHRLQEFEAAIEVEGKDGFGKQKKKREKKRRTSKSSYKHVPHREKPVHMVARRNARERKRVQAVNSAFVRLRKVVPVENRGKRLSKVKTLHRAIEYIDELTRILEEESNASNGGGASDNDCHKALLSTTSGSDTKSSRKGKILIATVDSKSCSSLGHQSSQSPLAAIDQSDAVGHFLEGPFFNEYHQHHHHHQHQHQHHPEHAPTALMTSSSCTSGALLTRRHHQQQNQQQQQHHPHHQLQHQNALSTFAFSSSASLATPSSSSLF